MKGLRQSVVKWNSEYTAQGVCIYMSVLVLVCVCMWACVCVRFSVSVSVRFRSRVRSRVCHVSWRWCGEQ